MGTYSLLLLVARVAVTPVAGLWADRTDRRRILLATNPAMAALALVPLLVRGPDLIGLAYLGAALLSAAQALFSPALAFVRSHPVLWSMLLAGLAFAASTLLYTALPIYWLLAATVVLEGAFVEALFVVLNIWWQESTPDALRGRVFALREMTDRTGQALSMVVGGWAAHLLGVRAVFFGIAGVLGLATLAAVAFAMQAKGQAAPATSRHG